MPGLTNWDPYKKHVQGGLPDGNYINAQFIVIAAGPPHLADIGEVDFTNSAGGNDLVFPIGLVQNFSLGQNKQFSRIFEIGSDRTYFIAGRTVGQLSLSRVLFHGPSLLRTMYAWYQSSNATEAGATDFDPLYSGPLTQFADQPFAAGTGRVKKGHGHQTRIPPGYGNLFINLASDLFSQPIGLFLGVQDNDDNLIGSVYIENCVVPTYNFGFDSMGLIVQEQLGIQYERIIPIQTNVEVQLVSGVLDDHSYY